MTAKRLIVISLGSYTLKLSLNVLADQKLTQKIKITKYIEKIDPEKKFDFEGKTMHLYPFLHPSNRNRNVNPKIERQEQKFIKRIRTFQ
ncbi:MAG: hypothetical protein GF308_07485 [Candidatus Heimdallarchaeota archaeon]|nr:hypothetical protein [Candidatus Heimdallarchaeota archaeon]